MGGIVRDADPSTATAALAASKAAFAELLGSLPGASAHERPGVRWVDTGLPDSVFNGVHDVAAEGFADSVALVRAHFAARGVPFHWETGLRPEPPDSDAILTGHGLRHVEDEPGMWLDLTRPRPAAPAVAGLSIRPVADDEALRDWVWTWGCGAPDEVTEPWYRAYSALPHGPGTALRMFVGYLGGRPAVTAYLFLAAGVAAVHYVVTRPEHRRLGLGTAMTATVLDEAVDAGRRVAVLTASPSGTGIYRRLGFRECCLVRTYEWGPPAG
ncbi:GNAT family N-acetyltransferase [Saccharothrix sp. S26]|uniref:GNAT family N-acetyltransferase n=1 Tax=Saccharothrix sp. S26 TaxID=2907215 RepID=UPI001F4840FD|nr:GNAT family N-acetyltransferase [Saccharothrix sp. S26]MCE6995101.1 GNAT family N-acetyltransferase [Saccharothrix sp. S26]